MIPPELLSRPKYFAKYRGKTAKEVYRLAKGIIISKSIIKPAIYAVYSIPRELTSGVIYTAVGCAGECLIGYFSVIGLSRWVYKTTDVKFIKNSARIIYNVCCLPVTIYSNSACNLCDVIGISQFEKAWFGCPVYIFNDNRLWIETNFTINDAFKQMCIGDK